MKAGYCCASITTQSAICGDFPKARERPRIGRDSSVWSLLGLISAAKVALVPLFSGLKIPVSWRRTPCSGSWRRSPRGARSRGLRSKPKFDPTINYGYVLTALSIVIAGTGAYYGMSSELYNVDQRVAKIESTLQQLANVMVLTARQDERLIPIERRVDRLEESPRRQP
jgi:hypothetical protein